MSKMVISINDVQKVVC